VNRRVQPQAHINDACPAHRHQKRHTDKRLQDREEQQALQEVGALHKIVAAQNNKHEKQRADEPVVEEGPLRPVGLGPRPQLGWDVLQGVVIQHIRDAVEVHGPVVGRTYPKGQHRTPAELKECGSCVRRGDAI